MFTFVHKEGRGRFANVHVAFLRVIFQIWGKVATCKKKMFTPNTNLGIHTLKKDFAGTFLKEAKKNII